MTDYRGMGWRRDLPDWRDLKLTPRPTGMLAAFPRYVNLTLTGKFTPIWSQQHLGSCTELAASDAWCSDRANQKLPFVMPSRLFVYFNSRAIEGTSGSDSGASIRDSFKAMISLGACAETLWPYDVSQFAVKPPPSDYADAVKHVGVEYAQVAQDINSLKAVITGGFPVVFGFTVYESFMSDAVASTGLMPMPGMNER